MTYHHRLVGLETLALQARYDGRFEVIPVNTSSALTATHNLCFIEANIRNWTTLHQAVDEGDNSLDEDDGTHGIDRIEYHPVLTQPREEAENGEADEGYSPEIDEGLDYQRPEELEEQRLWNQVYVCA